MALRYRNEYVLSTLRTAYSLKHCDDSLLLNEMYGVKHRDPGDIEADIANLSSRLQSDANEIHATRSQSSVSVAGRNSSSDGDDEEDEYKSPLGEEPAPIHEAREQEAAAGGTPANLLQGVKLQPFAHVKDFGLDIDDDSDFEDNILQAAHDIKHSVNPSSQKSDSSHRHSGRFSSPSSRGSHTSGGASSLEMPDWFAKREVVSVSSDSPRSSRLTSKLSISHRDPREQYMEAIAGLETSGVLGIQFKMHLKSQEPLDITVKQDCTTHLAIGYALLKAGVEHGDANMFNLRIVEDDGEPDEDFPALDRTRPVASYHVDEFAIVKATEAEFRENTKRTPNKISFKSASINRSASNMYPLNGNAASVTSLNSASSGKTNGVTSTARNSAGPADTASGLERSASASKIVLDRQTSVEAQKQPQQQPQQLLSQNDTEAQSQDEPQPRHWGPLPPQQSSPKSRLRLSAMNTSYSSSLSGSKVETAAVKIFMHPYDPILSQVFWMDELTPCQSRLKDVFEQMCSDKMMDSEMYVLRKADSTHQIVNMNSLLSAFIAPIESPQGTASLSNGSEGAAGKSMSHDEMRIVSFELIARRNLPPSQQTSRPRSASRTTLNDGHAHDSGNKAKKKSSNDILQNTVLAMQPLGFYKYPVLRRQQMNFLSRGERELVIDGEYIHIMPPTDWSLLDQPKTTTFHIRQVLRVKQSRKVSTNFSITVMKPTGPKRYDLESTDTSTTVEIVDRLQRLRSARSKAIGI